MISNPSVATLGNGTGVCVSSILARKLGATWLDGCPADAQHLPDAPAVAVAAVVGQAIQVLRPYGQVRVGNESLRRSEAPILPAAPVGWSLTMNTRATGGLLTDHRQPSRMDLPLARI
jgi:hypothetical protein